MAQSSILLLYVFRQVTSSAISWKSFFFCKPVLWLPNRLGLQGKFWQHCQNIEQSQSWENTTTKRFVEWNSFTVITNSSSNKEVAPLGLGAEHGHLYLVMKAVSTLQCDVAAFEGKTVTLLCSDSVTHSRVPVAIWILEVNKALRCWSCWIRNPTIRSSSWPGMSCTYNQLTIDVNDWTKWSFVT